MFPVRFLFFVLSTKLRFVVANASFLLMIACAAFQKEGKRAIAMIGRGVFVQHLPRNVYIARKT
jgi:hypothetical protein